MEKIIWVVGNNRQDMIEAQRQINSMGSMRAVVMLSYDAVSKMAKSQSKINGNRLYTPSLIILDYDMECEVEFASLSLIRSQQALAGVPLFFMVKNRSEETDELCYDKGAMVILTKPFSRRELLRIERTAWQHEMTRNYEKILQKQAGDIQAAKEIMRLNKQLKSRNELLYKIFGRYFSDKVLDVILESPDGAAIGGERRNMTVMTSDLRGFTSISEELDAELVTDLLNKYFGTMVDIIGKYHGTVIEFLGDSILAVFGAPLESKQHADEAVAAALEMQNEMAAVNVYAKKMGYPELEMGIGIHTGCAFIGNIGSDKMMRYNVIGGIVNECSRIESYTVGGQIYVSEDVIANMNGSVRVSNRLEVAAKGLHKPIEICDVMGISGSYECELNQRVDEYAVSLDDVMMFEMHTIIDNKIEKIMINARVEELTTKHAVVAMEHGTVSVFDDVWITAKNEDGDELFRDIYAKIIDKNREIVTLRFTHVGRDFTDYVKYVNEHIM